MLEQNHRGCRVMKLVMGLYYSSLKVVDLVLRPHHLKSFTFVGHWIARFEKMTIPNEEHFVVERLLQNKELFGTKRLLQMKSLVVLEGFLKGINFG